MLEIKDMAGDPVVVEVSAEAGQMIDAPITITDGAAAQMRRVIARRQRTAPASFVRVGVKGGGCSGMSYVLEPDTEFDNRDVTWVAGGMRIVSDERSLSFIKGMTIDYDIKNLMEGGFVFDNPNASRSCGCGTSFTPK